MAGPIMSDEPETVSYALTAAQIAVKADDKNDLLLKITSVDEDRLYHLDASDLVNLTRYLLCWCVTAYGQQEVAAAMAPDGKVIN